MVPPSNYVQDALQALAGTVWASLQVLRSSEQPSEFWQLLIDLSPWRSHVLRAITKELASVYGLPSTWTRTLSLLGYFPLRPHLPRPFLLFYTVDDYARRDDTGLPYRETGRKCRIVLPDSAHLFHTCIFGIQKRFDHALSHGSSRYRTKSQQFPLNEHNYLSPLASHVI